MPVYLDILEKLSNQVRISDAPRKFTMSEVKKIVEVAILEERVNSYNTHVVESVDSLKSKLNEKTSNYFGHFVD